MDSAGATLFIPQRLDWADANFPKPENPIPVFCFSRQVYARSELAIKHWARHLPVFDLG
jgi:hypothetical protein